MSLFSWNAHGIALECEILEGRLLPAGFAYEQTMAAFQAGWVLAENLHSEVSVQRQIETDLDGDGQVDHIALIRPEDAGPWMLVVSRLLDGELVTTQEVILGDVAESILAEDLDQDGLIDLFVPGDSAEHSTFLRGRRDGLFDVFQRHPGPVALAVGDLTGNGMDDFVFASPILDQLSVQIGKGQPTLLDKVPFGMFSPGEVHLADMNADGNLDLVVCNGGGANVVIFPGLGDGTFDLEVPDGWAITTGAGRAHVAITYLNDMRVQDPVTGEEHDPFPDLVVVSEGESTLTIFFGQSGFALQRSRQMKVGLLPVAVTVGDATGDGLVDLVVTNRGDNTVHVLSGLGDGHFHDLPRILPTGRSPVESFIGDFDGDGRVDLVSLDSGSNSLTFYSDVASPLTMRRVIGSGGSEPTTALMRDLNDDAISDLIVAHRGDGTLAVFLGGANGLTLVDTISSPVDNPAVLVPSTQYLESQGFYVVGDESHVAALVTVAIPVGPVIPPLAPDEERPIIEPPRLTIDAELQAVTDRLGDVVLTLVTTPHPRLRFGLIAEETDMVALADEAGASMPSSGGSRDDESQEESDEEENDVATNSQPVTVERFLLGLDEVTAPAVGTDGRTDSPPPMPEVMPVPPASEPEAPARGSEPEPADVEEPDVQDLPPMRTTPALALTSAPELMLALGTVAVASLERARKYRRSLQLQRWWQMLVARRNPDVPIRPGSP